MVQESPWPATSGGRIRLDNVLRGLCLAGEVDLIVVAPQRGNEELQVPTGLPIARVETLSLPEYAWPDTGLAGRAAWLIAGKLPTELVKREYSSLRDAFRLRARHSYDLAWFSRVETFVGVGGYSAAPVIVDIDDLQDQRSRGWVESSKRTPRSDLRPVRQRMNRMRHRKNAGLWRRLQHRVASSVEAVAVCSEIDRLRLGVPNAFVLPNGYEPPVNPLGRVSVAEPPTVVFPGNFTYSPNIDGARYLISEILPRLASRIPEVRVRLVGDAGPEVRTLQQVPRVVVTGFVPEVTTELAKADVIVVPLRYGSGTRIKVLEAFAHRIPVVSTSAGVEGIDVEPGRHLLVASMPDDFADACVELLTDVSRRRDLVQEAHELFEANYRWEDIRDRIASLAGALASSSKSPTPTAGSVR